MKSKKQISTIIIISVVAVIFALLIGTIIFLTKSSESKNLIEISGYYDKDGNPIHTGQTFAVVNNIEGVQYITVDVNALNKDTIPLNFEITSLSPAVFSSSITKINITAQPDKYATWKSGLIDVSQFINQTVNFQVSVRASASPFRDPVTKTAGISFDVKPNPQASFDLGFNSSVGDGAGDPAFVPSFSIIKSFYSTWEIAKTQLSISTNQVPIDMNGDGIRESKEGYRTCVITISPTIDRYTSSLNNAQYSHGFTTHSPAWLVSWEQSQDIPNWILLNNPSLPHEEIVCFAGA